MERILSKIASVCLVAFSFLPALSGIPPADIPLQELLPSQAELGDWKAEGTPQIFRGEDLFIYIDGGAEIYFEYEFRQALVQDYKDKKGHRISLEIFEMASPGSAYGIYSFKTSPQGIELNLGDESQIADYYLNLRKGSLLITVTGLDEENETKEGLISLARAVEAKIKGGAPRPSLVGLLPQENLLKQSVKFFKGPLGLYNSYPFFTADVFAFEKGAKGDYEPGYSLFLLEYPEEHVSRQKYAAAKKNFQQSQKYRNFADSGEIFKVADQKGKLIYGSRTGRYLMIILGQENFEDAENIFCRLEQRLKIK